MPDDQITAEATAFDPVYVQRQQHTVTRSVAVPEIAERPAAPTFHPAPTSTPLDQVIVRHYRLATEEPDESISSRVYPIAKRALDLTLTIPALLLLGPVMLLIALAIRLDTPGPAIFSQQRVGQHGRLFTIYKFRSMTDGAGVRMGRIHKIENDNRVTGVGRLLRKTSLDELPQLINVLLGQMSLVGPRPELPEIMLERYEPWQYKRLAVPQGITGWWQVTGRGKKLLWKHTADDLYYVERADFWFDIKLILMTIRAVLSRDGAF